MYILYTANQLLSSEFLSFVVTVSNSIVHYIYLKGTHDTLKSVVNFNGIISETIKILKDHYD